MKRRTVLRSLAWLVATGAVAYPIAGCGKKETAQTDPPAPPAPEPTETPVAEVTPEPEESPQIATDEPTPPPTADEPQAPYGELTADQQARLDRVMESLSEVNANEAKRWTENLAYDATGREREVRVWEAISDAYTRYSSERPGINDAAKQEAFNVLLATSLVGATNISRYVKLSALSSGDADAVATLLVSDVSSN